MRVVMLVVAAISIGCTALVDLPRKHLSDTGTEVDSGWDTVEAADSSLDESEAVDLPDAPADTEVPDILDTLDAELDADSEVPPCGPTDDCDGDGLSPLGGDCCDSDPQVHPMQPEWFYVPYTCPETSWDYDCSGVEEYEQEGLRHGLDASVGEGCHSFSYYTCLATDPEGWVDGPPSCGEVELYVACWGVGPSGYGYCDERTTYFNGIMGCH